MLTVVIIGSSYNYSWELQDMMLELTVFTHGETIKQNRLLRGIRNTHSLEGNVARIVRQFFPS